METIDNLQELLDYTVYKKTHVKSVTWDIVTCENGDKLKLNY